MKIRSEKGKRARKSGIVSEGLAAFWLILKGYRILAWRYKTPFGEIDLIVAKRNLVAFVEVKKRKTMEDALHAVSPSARNRIRRTAEHYAARTRLPASTTLRFDLMATCGGLRFRHIQNAWG